MTMPSHDDLQRCVELLEFFVDDRTRLVGFDHDLRIRLLQASGRLSRPTRDENRVAAKASRKMQRQQVLEHDRAVAGATEIRTARLADVYTPPRQLVSAAPPAPEATEERVRIKPRLCYVCKESFTRLHFFYDS